jgi:hypothetical protein
MVVAPASVAAAAVTATSLPAPVPPDTTIAAPSVDLSALVSAANSTSQFFAGSSYYGTDWTTVYGDQTVVPFLSGPQGIADAITNAQTGANQTGVTGSGWGAGQTGTALGILAQNNPSVLNSVGLVILDNNTNRAGGGFWTTYAPFAPLLLTSADPTPTNLPGSVKVLDVAYEYNINSDAPVDPLNPFALGNSLAAYAYGYGQESTALDITQEDPGSPVMFHPAGGGTPVELKPGTQYIVKDGKIIGTTSAGTANSNPDTIYVTVVPDELPLTRPLRLLPGGDILAAAIDPTMTQLVNAGYNDGKGLKDSSGAIVDPAIPNDPTVTRPMQPGSSLTGLGGVPGSVPLGATDGAQTAIQDVTNPGNFVTKPLGEAGKLPFISTLSPSTLTNSSLSTGTLKANSPNKFVPVLPGVGNNNSSSSSAANGSKAVKNFTDQVKDAVNKVTGGLTGAKPAATNAP